MEVVIGMLIFIGFLFVIVFTKLNSGTDEQINAMEGKYKNKLQENIADIHRTVYDEHMETQSKGFEFQPTGGLNDKSN